MINLKTLSEEESDFFEHELYVVQVFEGVQNDGPPLFFRHFMSKSNIDWYIGQGWRIEPINKIGKSPILSRSRFFTQVCDAEQTVQKLESIGIRCSIRKVDVRLKD